MFLGGLIGVRAHDLLPRVILVAVAPRSRARRSGADAPRGPNIRDLTRSVTPEVPFVRPKCLIRIEVLRGKQIDRQRLHARRWPRKCRRISPTAPSLLYLRRLRSRRCPLRRRLRPPRLRSGCRTERRSREQQEKQGQRQCERYETRSHLLT